MKKTWIKFPNGKVWLVDENGHTEGSVKVANYSDIDGLEERLDAIAEAVTDNLAGLNDFSYQYLGNDIVAFSGNVGEMLDNEDEETTELAAESTELRECLKAQYSLMDIEADHAMSNLDSEYGEECVLAVVGSHRELRCPSYPEECTYVRIVVDGLEIGHWVDDEWGGAPAEVMGAIIGAARGGNQ